MAIRGKHAQVDTVMGREKETSHGLLIFRQSKWGEVNGETTLSVYDWDAAAKTPLGRTETVLALDYPSLMHLASSALKMAGHKGAARAIIERIKKDERVRDT